MTPSEAVTEGYTLAPLALDAFSHTGASALSPLNRDGARKFSGGIPRSSPVFQVLECKVVKVPIEQILQPEPEAVSGVRVLPGFIGVVASPVGVAAYPSEQLEVPDYELKFLQGIEFP